MERGFDPGEHQHESTLTLLSEPSNDLGEYMEDVRNLRMPVDNFDVKLLNRAVEEYTALGRDKALEHLQTLKLADFTPFNWTREEEQKLEAELERVGGLDAHSASKAIGRKPADVVRYTYMWKNKKLKGENELIRQHRKVHAAHGRSNSKTLGPPTLGKIRSRAESEAVDDDTSSLYNAAFVSTNKLQCAACSTRISNVWWKCPRTVQGNAMCESCGSNYRKYGVISFVKADDAKLRPDKKEPRTAGGRRKGGDSLSGTATPVPTGVPRLPPCSCCKRMEPKASMARCKTCTFSVHAGCYGIPLESLGPGWECELCANEREEEANLEPWCVLCPRDSAMVASKIKSKKQVGDFDLLSALKPTEGCRWAHILCSAWMPEVQYANGSTFKTVEGISTIAADKWDAVSVPGVAHEVRN